MIRPSHVPRTWLRGSCSETTSARRSSYGVTNTDLRRRFRPLGDLGPSPAVSGYIDAARAAERVGQRHLARSHYEEALRSLTGGDELPTATTILRWIAGSHFADANHAAAEDCVTAAIATAEAWGDSLAVGYAVNMLG